VEFSEASWMENKTCFCSTKLMIMSTQQDPYEAEVRRIAEILAFFRYLKETYFGDFFTEDDKRRHWDKFDCKESYIKGKEEAARAMVAEMKIAHYKGYITGLAAMEQFPEDTETNIDRRTGYYSAAAKRLGLIPSPLNGYIPEKEEE